MIWLLIVFAALNLADAWTTFQAIRFGAKEAWLPMFLFRITGVYWGLVIIKVGIVAGIWYFANDLGPVFLAIADSAYTALIISNYHQLQKQKNG